MANGRYMVVVQKRINGKVRTKKKRNIKLIQEAKQCRKKFTYELNEEEMKHRDGQLKWKAAYEKYLKHIEQKIEDSQTQWVEDLSVPAHRPCKVWWVWTAT